jgi:hypothetical protein
MKNTFAKALFVAAMPFAVGAAFADDITPEPRQAASTVSREQVRAELDKARAAGELVSGEQTFVAKDAARSTVSREQVRADAIAAYKTRKNAYQAWNQS